MSVAEMKLVAIAQVLKLENESQVKEIIKHIKKLYEDKENIAFDAVEFFEKTDQQYGDVLKKLAD